MLAKEGGNHSNRSFDKPSVSSHTNPPLPKTEKTTPSATRPQISTKSSGHRHHKSNKSFDIFLKDTNDEWSDELGYDTKQRSIRQQQQQQQVDRLPQEEQQQQQQQLSSQQQQTSLSPTAAIPTSPRTDNQASSDNKRAKSKSSNGVKLDVKQLLEGRICLIRTWPAYLQEPKTAC